MALRSRAPFRVVTDSLTEMGVEIPEATVAWRKREAQKATPSRHWWAE